MAGELGLLCHKHGVNRLCYKHGGSKLIFKCAAGGETTVTFAWGGDCRDLDILAYWDGAPDLTAGYNHGSGGTSGPYHLSWSGDITSADASEWCKIKMTPWSGSNTRTFCVHFNYFGYGDDYPGSTCTVVVSQEGGQTLFKSNQNCGTRNGQAAATSDPYCVITFDATGNLVSVN